jgi:hypothetical protein
MEFRCPHYSFRFPALVFRRNGPRDPAHQDKATAREVYQMEDPAPRLPGGLRLLISFTPGRQVQYSRLVGGNLVPLQLPPDFGTAQVIGQSARAAGAPRSEGGEHGDLWHGRINSRRGGGAAGPRTRVQQQPRVEVTVRLDVRLPALGAARNKLQVPSTRHIWDRPGKAALPPGRSPWRFGFPGELQGAADGRLGA